MSIQPPFFPIRSDFTSPASIRVMVLELHKKIPHLSDETIAEHISMRIKEVTATEVRAIIDAG